MHHTSSDDINDLSSLREYVAYHQRQAAIIAPAAARLETTGAWGIDGSVSMAAWLRNHTKMSAHDASRLLVEGRFLNRNTIVADAAISGKLSASQIAACAP